MPVSAPMLTRSILPAVSDRAALKAPTSAVDDLTPLVESAMLAACTGLAYHFSASFRLESYLGALFPFPVVLAAARWGCDAAWKTLVGLTVSPAFSGFAALTRQLRRR